MKTSFLQLARAMCAAGLLGSSSLGQEPSAGSFVPPGKVWKKAEVLRTTANAQVIRFSRDGRLAVLAAHQGVSIWDWKAGKELSYFTFPKKTKLTSLEISNDGKRMASSHLDTTRVLVWDVTKGAVVHQFNHEAPVLALAFSEDGKYLASGGGHPPAEKAGKDCFVQVWRLSDGLPVKRFLGPQRPVRTLVLTDDSAVAEDTHGEVFAWSRVSGEFERRISTHSFVTPLQILSKGRTLIGYETGAGRYLSRWDSALDTKDRLIDMSPTNQPVAGFACSVDGTLAASAHTGELLVWDLQAKEHLSTLPLPQDCDVIALAFSADGSEIVVALSNKSVVRLPVKKAR